VGMAIRDEAHLTMTDLTVALLVVVVGMATEMDDQEVLQVATVNR